MEYMLLIYQDESTQAEMDPSEREKMWAAYGEYTKALEEAGVLRAGQPLQPIATATTVRVRDGRTATTDGPFAETKEQLGGYYLMECKDLDEAIEYASRIPSARYGSVEVRPIWQFE